MKQLHHSRMLRDKQFRQLFEVCFSRGSLPVVHQFSWAFEKKKKIVAEKNITCKEYSTVNQKCRMQGAAFLKHY